MDGSIRIEYTSWYLHELGALPLDQIARIERRMEMLERKGLRRAFADGDLKVLRDGICEVRVVGRGPAYRLLCFLVEGTTPRLVVLTSCVTKATMDKPLRREAEVARAIGRRERWLRGEGG